MTLSAASLIAEGRRVLRIEAASVAALEERIDEEFVRACQMVADASGRTVVCGIGKSGHTPACRVLVNLRGPLPSR